MDTPRRKMDFLPANTTEDLLKLTQTGPAVLIRDDKANTWVITDKCLEQALRAYQGTISNIYRIEIHEKRRRNGSY